MAKATKTPETPKVKTVEELQAENEELQAKILELQEVNEALAQKIEEREEAQPDAPEPKKKAVLPKQSFKVGKDEHVFVVPQFTNPLDGHTVITAEEALTNKELLAHLAANDTGITRPKNG